MPPDALEDKPGQKKEEEGNMMQPSMCSPLVWCLFSLSVKPSPANCWLPTIAKVVDIIIARTELERREHYMRMIYSQQREHHPLLQVIERCLDFPEDRPSIGEVLRLLEQARAEDRDEQMEMNKLELLQALQTQPRNQPRNQVRECVC